MNAKKKPAAHQVTAADNNTISIADPSAMAPVRFDELSLSEPLMSAINDLGYENATPIQALAIPKLREGIDVIGQAQTGTGKTFAFGIPVIEKIDPSKKYVQALIMCPTRELAMQVSDEMSKLVKYKGKINILSIFGGASITNQINALRKGVHIVVGTPGRIMDHLDRGTLHLDLAQTVVLDEADEMLDMGFRDDIEAVMEELDDNRQTIFFSATMAQPIMDLARKYMRDPEVIKVMRTELTAAKINQQYFDVKERDKPAILQRLVDMYEPKLCLVFTNTKRKADDVVEALQQQGFFAEALHGDMRQATRTQVMNKFRQGVIQVLVATDVAARGIDVDNVEMVVNYDIPLDTEYYVHRIGRTGRAGREGYAFTLATSKERSKLNQIERYAKTTIARGTIPGRKDIEDKKKNNFLERVYTTIQAGDLEKYMGWANEMIEKHPEVEMNQLAGALLKMELHHLIGKEEKLESESLVADDFRFGSNKEGRNGRSNGEWTRLFLSLGKKDHIMPKDIVGAIVNECGLNGRAVGSIDLYDKFSFVEVAAHHAKEIVAGMKDARIKGKDFNLGVAEDSSSETQGRKGRSGAGGYGGPRDRKKGFGSSSKAPRGGFGRGR